MNVRCDSCDTVYRIDPLKVPVEGVHARCTVCSAVIPIERVTEQDAPATDRPMTAHAPSTEDRIAHALGDAFIPAPHDDDADSSATADDPYRGMQLPDDNISEEQWKAERTSERHAVESMPGIIMPPLEDDLYTPPSERSLPAAPEASSVLDGPSNEGTVEPLSPRVSRPFVPPRDLAFAKPTLEKAPEQLRPTAPVFRPTPGRPAQTPMAPPPASVSRPAAPPVRPFRPGSPPMAPPVQPVSPPTSTPARPSAPVPPPRITPDPPLAAPPTRPINPFLSRDPGQKARRLARALISDMIVYQPEKRQKALEDGTLADAFEEEIKKSWREYVEQIGEEVANSTSYFNDALNDLLADGEKMF